MLMCLDISCVLGARTRESMCRCSSWGLKKKEKRKSRIVLLELFSNLIKGASIMVNRALTMISKSGFALSRYPRVLRHSFSRKSPKIMAKTLTVNSRFSAKRVCKLASTKTFALKRFLVSSRVRRLKKVRNGYESMCNAAAKGLPRFASFQSCKICKLLVGEGSPSRKAWICRFARSCISVTMISIS